MDNAIRVRIDGPQALYIADCLRRERQAAHLPLGPGSLVAYWQQLIEERLDGDGFFLWVPLHIAPHGAELAESYDLTGNDVLDIAIALSDWGYDHMARLWAQLYASLAWNVAREILPAGLMRGREYIDLSTIGGRRFFENGMRRRDREHGIPKRPPMSLREQFVFAQRREG